LPWYWAVGAVCAIDPSHVEIMHYSDAVTAASIINIVTECQQFNVTLPAAINLRILHVGKMPSTTSIFNDIDSGTMYHNIMS
jgi:hypothetical protein